MAKKPKELTQYGTPLSDEWNTSHDVANLMGLVDFDPFSNPTSVIQARRRGGLDIGVDGFDLANWPQVGPRGNEPFIDVGMNPPFSQMARSIGVLNDWLDVDHTHRSAVVIHKADLSTKWCQALYDNFNYRLCIPPKRINYVSNRGTSSNFCSVVSCVGPSSWFEQGCILEGWKVVK